MLDIADQAFSQLGHQPQLLIEDSAAIVTGRADDMGRAAGMVSGGRIYIFRDAIKDAGDAVRVIWHEVLHYGIRRFLTADQYIDEMKGLASRDALLKMQANAWVMNSKDAQTAKKYAEESVGLKWRVDDYVFARGVDEALAKSAEKNDPNNRKYANNSIHKRVLCNKRLDQAWRT